MKLHDENTINFFHYFITHQSIKVGLESKFTYFQGKIHWIPSFYGQYSFRDHLSNIKINTLRWYNSHFRLKKKKKKNYLKFKEPHKIHWRNKTNTAKRLFSLPLLIQFVLFMRTRDYLCLQRKIYFREFCALIVQPKRNG